ncbi:MAG: lipopolysaccharide transport periplasmic protein LptA [Rhodocyclaceae bacterium]|jgi:lipopolysaccharide export system protein LptA|nr:lipopolysaccharide transport periplasmic protein LptA [Rhodocyclaceae bacterium]
MTPFHRTIFVVLACTLTMGQALAERADRQKPVELEADRVTVDDKSQSQIFDGAVNLVQGTLQLKAARLEVTQDGSGFQRGTAQGDSKAQAWFKQKREGRTDYVEGQADKIVHDSKNEITEFIGKAQVKNGADEVSGPYIRYDAKSQSYLVNNLDATGKPTAPEASGGRVRAVIQPKTDPSPVSAPATP